MQTPASCFSALYSGTVQHRQKHSAGISCAFILPVFVSRQIDNTCSFAHTFSGPPLSGGNPDLKTLLLSLYAFPFLSLSSVNPVRAPSAAVGSGLVQHAVLIPEKTADLPGVGLVTQAF